MSEKGFKGLLVWQRAKDLAVSIYTISQHQALARDFSLRDQIRRSAVSVASNLAEGDERETDNEVVRYCYIAKGSVGELRTQLQIAFEIGALEKSHYDNLDKQYETLGKMIGSLIKARRRPRASSPVPRAKSYV